MASKLYTDIYVSDHAQEVPNITTGGFRNWLGQTTDRLTVTAYAGKVISGKHCWFANCSCGAGNILITSTGLCTTKSCGCLGRENASIANKGNRAGEKTKNPERTKERLKQVKPEYDIVDMKDGRVMSKWDFRCNKCGEYFSARPDNILPRKNNGAQTPCACCIRGGYSNFKDGAFYVLAVDDFCKFGISNDFEKRYKQLCKSYGKELDVELIIYIQSGIKACKIEKHIKSEFNYRVPVGDVDGKTEYRHREDLIPIIQEAMRISCIV